MHGNRAPGLAPLLVYLLRRHTSSLDKAARIAIRHHLAGLFLDGVNTLDQRGQLEGATIDLLRAAARHEAADDVLCARESAEVLAAVSSLCPVVLKGRLLAQELWPPTVHRPAGDLDLLLEPDAVTEAARLLTAAGYRIAPQPIASSTSRWRRADTGIELLPPSPRRMVVDLHARLFRSVGHRIDARRVLARARQTRLDGHPVRRLDDADRLLYLAVHAAKHAARELKWILDLNAATAASDEKTWNQAISRAHATRTTRPFWAAFSLVNHRDLSSLRPSPPWPRLLHKLISEDHAITARPTTRWERYALEVALEESLATRASMLLGMLARRFVEG